MATDFRIVIPSRKPENAIRCVQSIFEKDPTIPHSHIIIVDDGSGTPEARAALPGVTWLPGLKPFNFSRNSNMGIAYANEDCILLGDDTTLTTPRGFTFLADQASSTAITVVQNTGLFATDYPVQMTKITSARSFIGVYIPRHVYIRLGPLDERYVLYGWEDTDYCRRAIMMGFGIATFGGCVIDHNHDFATFHGPEETNGITHFYYGDNSEVFKKKWDRQ